MAERSLPSGAPLGLGSASYKRAAASVLPGTNSGGMQPKVLIARAPNKSSRSPITKAFHPNRFHLAACHSRQRPGCSKAKSCWYLALSVSSNSQANLAGIEHCQCHRMLVHMSHATFGLLYLINRPVPMETARAFDVLLAKHRALQISVCGDIWLPADIA